MKYTKILYLAGLLLAAACAEDDLQERAGGQKVPVSLSYRALQADDTRASASQTLNEDVIASGKEVMVRISEYNKAAWVNHIYTTGTAGALILPTTNTPFYPLNGTNIDIKAFYPAAAASGTHTVANDQTVDDNYINSDLMVAALVSNQAKQEAPVELTFAHKMAKIMVNLTPGPGVRQINSATLKQVRRTVSFTLSDGTISSASGTQDDIALVSGEATDGVTIHGAAVIPPQTITGNLLTVGVTMTDGSNRTATYSVSSGKAFAEGNVYTLNIGVRESETNATTDITSWADNGSVTVKSNHSSPNTFVVNGVAFRMVPVKGGSYTKFGGSTVTGTLSDFMIGETEVTRGLWKAVMGGMFWPDGSAINSTMVPLDDGTISCDNYPMSRVSWDDINQASTGFLARLNALTEGQRPANMEFQLPTDAQWEYAARGGSYQSSETYAGSNTLSDVGWWGNINSEQVGANADGASHPVGQLQANALGLYDMSGNVWEWCQDWYQSATPISLGTDYVQPTYNGVSGRVFRGGGWSNKSTYCEVSNCSNYPPDSRFHNMGFRLVLAPKRLTFLVNGVRFNMTLVKGGTYETLGGQAVTGTLTDYYIGQVEVTRGLWKAVMDGLKYPDGTAIDGTLFKPAESGTTYDSYPMALMSWNEITQASTGFLDRLNTLTEGQRPAGMTFKLPSEAQWEYAARSGARKDSYTYAGSNTIGDVAWWGSNSGSNTHPNAEKNHNKLCLYDMTGNVQEICLDMYNTFSSSDLGENYVQTEGSSCVSRGGSFKTESQHMTVTYRNNVSVGSHYVEVGFRLALQ